MCLCVFVCLCTNTHKHTNTQTDPYFPHELLKNAKSPGRAPAQMCLWACGIVRKHTNTTHTKTHTNRRAVKKRQVAGPSPREDVFVCFCVCVVFVCLCV